MKKITVLLLLAALLMTAGCGAKQPAETPATPSPDVSVPETEAPVATPEATPEPTPEPVPDCVDAVVQVDRSPAILTLLKRGDQVDVVGEYDDEHYVIKTELGYGLMEKQLLRISGDGILVGGDIYIIQTNLQLQTGDIERPQIHSHQMVVGAAGDQIEAFFHQGIRQDLGIGDDVVGIGLEFRGHCLLETDGLCGDDMLQGAALGAGEDTGIQLLGKFLTAQN